MRVMRAISDRNSKSRDRRITRCSSQYKRIEKASCVAHLGTAKTEATLELGVDHALTAGNVLLIIGDVVVHTGPAAHLNLGAVALAELGGGSTELVAGHAAGGAELRETGKRERGKTIPSAPANDVVVRTNRQARKAGLFLTKQRRDNSIRPALVARVPRRARGAT